MVIVVIGYAIIELETNDQLNSISNDNSLQESQKNLPKKIKHSLVSVKSLSLRKIIST